MRHRRRFTEPEGANGVIVIKTKSGKGSTGKANVTFRYQHGFETQARKYNYLSARDYLVLSRKTWARGIDNFDINQRLYVAGNSATVPTYTAAGQYGYAKWTPAYVDNLVAVEGQPYVDNLMKSGWETIDDPVNPGHNHHLQRCALPGRFVEQGPNQELQCECRRRLVNGPITTFRSATSIRAGFFWVRVTSGSAVC
jgi:hypothetical protein